MIIRVHVIQPFDNAWLEARWSWHDKIIAVPKAIWTKSTVRTCNAYGGVLSMWTMQLHGFDQFVKAERINLIPQNYCKPSRACKNGRSIMCTPLCPFLTTTEAACDNSLQTKIHSFAKVPIVQAKGNQLNMSLASRPIASNTHVGNEECWSKWYFFSDHLKTISL